jgi:hypothetical protein
MRNTNLVSVFYMKITGFSNTFVKETVLHLMSVFDTFVENHVAVAVTRDFFLGLLFYSIAYVCAFIPIP